MNVKIVDFGKKKSNPRKNSEFNPTGHATKITIHHMAGIMGAEACAKMHLASSKSVSANYYIGKDGEIVSAVPEDRRAWTSSSKVNDYAAITIEVSNDTNKSPWTVSSKVYESLISLCVDICKRHMITPIYTGDSSGTITEHRMFAKTECPGDYLHSHMQHIVASINKEMNVTELHKEFIHVVEKGDTLYSISRKFGVTVSKIMMLNPQIHDANKIYPGMEVKIIK